MITRFAPILLVLMFAASCKSRPGDTGFHLDEVVLANEVVRYEGGEILITDFNGIKDLLSRKDGNTYVVNFWASWCKPCIKELPYFQELGEGPGRDKLRIIMVSLDFRSQAETTLVTFLEERKFNLPLVLLDDPDANSWINRVDPSWSGSIPATLIFRDDERAFYEKEFTREELNTIVQQF